MQPRSRSARQSLKTKDTLEKERLRHRTGGFFRYEDVRNPIDVQKGCPSHIAGIDRLTAGPACEEINYMERERKKVARDEVTESRRARILTREEARWRAVSAQESQADERTRRMQADPMLGRKNVSGHPFNIVNHDYDNTPQGAQLQHQDNMIRYRSKVREASLAMRNHLGFNPIIGEQSTMEDRKIDNLLKEFRAASVQMQRACVEEIKTQSGNALRDMKRELRKLVQDVFQQHTKERMEMQRASGVVHSELTGTDALDSSMAEQRRASSLQRSREQSLMVPSQQQQPQPPAALAMPVPPSTPPQGMTPLNQRKTSPLPPGWDAAFQRPSQHNSEENDFQLPNEVVHVSSSNNSGHDGSRRPTSRNRLRSSRNGPLPPLPASSQGHADAGAGGAKLPSVGFTPSTKGSVDDDGFAPSYDEPKQALSVSTFDEGSKREKLKKMKTRSIAPDEEYEELRQTTRQTQIGVRKLSLGMHAEFRKPSQGPKQPWHMMSAADLLKNSKFDNLIGFLILLNAATIGLQADHAARHLTDDYPGYFAVFERAFCVVFLLELLLRMYVYKLRFFCSLGKAIFWNYFDLFVVTAQVTEEGITFAASSSGVDLAKFRLLRILRILRLVRILRVVRVLHLISELRTIISSILGSFKSLAWTVVLLFLIIYIVGVYFTNTITDYLVDINNDASTSFSANDDSLRYYFSSLSRALLSLWEAMSGGADWDSMAGPLLDVHPIHCLCFVGYIAFAVLALMNVVTGVFVQTALQNAKEEEDLFLTDQVEKLFEIQDREDRTRITFEEIEARLANPETASDWKAINVAPTEAKYLFDLLDIDESGEIGFEEFLGGCLRLHGTAKSFDLLTVMQEHRAMAKLWNSYSEDFELQMEELRCQTISIGSVVTATAAEVERLSDMMNQNQESIMMMDQRIQTQVTSMAMFKRMISNLHAFMTSLSSSPEGLDSVAERPVSRGGIGFGEDFSLIPNDASVEV